jgi:hypothetical protein
VPDVIPAFVRREELERRGDEGQYLIERSWSRGAAEWSMAVVLKETQSTCSHT